ncbi:hypothetical protein HZC27_03750 [Candidatus Roizmanbacteria bacterium]|nr:hypothetical protein [Candidatus Roizmanbacteria bacterium]
MKKLEDKIINKMYVLETKKTGLSLITKTILFFFFGLSAIFLTQILVEVFFETGSDNVFEILQEDWQVVAKHGVDIIFSLYQEIPKPLILIIFVSFGISLLALLTFIKNFGKIRYKVIALSQYWKKGRNRKTT